MGRGIRHVTRKDRMKARTYLYVVTRRDMTPGYQGVQSIHAALEFAALYPDTFMYWNLSSNYLCWLSVKDEAVLASYLRAAEAKGIKSVGFYEPDIGDQLTAIAIESGRRSALMLRTLPLALKAYRKKGK